ncbi:MAG: serine/threonine protein kinase, partial [Actinobacteria bacterium]|nr:serine/threonine protein kinase [Actinomycetota bacterium]
MSLAGADRWVAVRRTFECAVDLPQEQRAAYVAASFGDDLEARAEVMALLEADDSAITHPVDRLAPAQDQAISERLPEVVGFRVARRLGAGGTSRVFEATCIENGRRVALKVIHGGANSQALQRFRQESRVLSRLSHPGIVGLHESGHTVDGQVYLSMDYVDGGTIDRWCEDHAADDRARVGLVVQVLEALSHAHGAGVIHRDLKPHNVLVDADARVRLVDFGVARLHREDGDRTGFRTETGNLVGTFAYMSPEQADGKASRVGPATDVYQAALVLFELLTGRLPYEIEDRGAMALLKA